MKVHPAGALTPTLRGSAAPVSLCEVLDRLLDTGVVVHGDVLITVADVELIYLSLRVLLSSVETARGAGANVPPATVRGGAAPLPPSLPQQQQQLHPFHPLHPAPMLQPAGAEARPGATASFQAAQAVPTVQAVQAVPTVPTGQAAQAAPTVQPAQAVPTVPTVHAVPAHGATSSAAIPTIVGPERPSPLPRPGGKLNVDPENVKNGLAQLVLVVVRLLHELLEKQAVKRIDGGSLTDEQIERLGTTLMLQAQELRKLQTLFGFDDEEMNLDLGPLGKLI